MYKPTPTPPSPTTLTAEGDAGRQADEEKAGLRYVRGCEVVELRDEKGTLMNDFTGRVRQDQAKAPEGNMRTLTVALDTAQYQVRGRRRLSTRTLTMLAR
jgi:intron-binding protein aquarius